MDIAQRINVLYRGGRRVDGDGTATLTCCLGAIAPWQCQPRVLLLLLNAGDVDGTLKTSRELT